jgi:hypothetical protein
MSRDIAIPRMFPVRQVFPRPKVEDLPAAIHEELSRVVPKGSLRPGAEIGVTVGSRGITAIAEITRAAVDFLKSRGAAPFIIPAMGSHGGAEAEAQAHLIEHYGVTEETVGAPVRPAMGTRSLGLSPEGVEVFLAETAWNSDGILLMNRVKPHTDFKGPIESGLTKIGAIGLGKLQGAQEYHKHIFGIGLGAAIRSAAAKIMETGKIIGGLAIFENAYHETARFAGVPLDGFFETEEKLLKDAFALMGKLPVDELDVLFIDRIGKNISGAGMDTNIIGRGVYGYIAGEPWFEGLPSITRIVLSDLSDESDGNGVGMGMAEYCTRRFYDKVNHSITALNAMTANAPMGARTPVILENDREALLAGVSTVQCRPEGPRVAYIHDTLALEHVYLSEACLPLVDGREGIEILGEPRDFEFDADGYVVSPFKS